MDRGSVDRWSRAVPNVAHLGCDGGGMSTRQIKPVTDGEFRRVLLNAGLLERPRPRARAWCQPCQRMVTGRVRWQR